MITRIAKYPRNANSAPTAIANSPTTTSCITSSRSRPLVACSSATPSGHTIAHGERDREERPRTGMPDVTAWTDEFRWVSLSNCANLTIWPSGACRSEEEPVFARLGPWCHDRRKLVLGLWIAVLVLGGVVSGGVGERASATSSTCPTSSRRPGFDILDEHFGGQGTGISRHDRVPRRAGRRRPRGRGGDAGAVRPRSPTIEDVDPGREPLRRGRRAQIASRGPGRRQDRLRQRRDARRHRASRAPARSATRSSRTTPEIDGLAGRARRLHLRRVRRAVVRGPRPRVRHRHPDRRVRLGAGHGPARSASRCSASASAPPSSRC